MTSQKKLLSVIDSFAGVPILVIGDLILDHYVWGKVSRISPEAPVVVVQVTKEEKRLGGAGNVAHNLAALGARALMCGVIGEDDGGKDVTRMLAGLNIDAQGVVVEPLRRTTVKTRVIAHAQQVVRVDREVTCALELSASDALTRHIAGTAPQMRGIIVSDYAKGVICPSVFAPLEHCYSQGILGFGKIPLLIDPKAPNFSVYSRATVIKPNRSEAEEACFMEIPDRSHAIEAGEKLLKKWNCEMVLMTLGEDGMVLVSDIKNIDSALEIDTMAREVYDVSGAGDTVSAVFTLALAVGAHPQDAAQLANYAAGIVVSEIGTVAVNADDLRRAVEEGE
jgi:D-beta-D-heptose 7-phosphate kinase/D-beta-D-heptose 1-phosphate adenosyltransferase